LSNEGKTSMPRSNDSSTSVNRKKPALNASSSEKSTQSLEETTPSFEHSISSITDYLSAVEPVTPVSSDKPSRPLEAETLSFDRPIPLNAPFSVSPVETYISTTEAILPESRTLLPLKDHDIHESLKRLSRLSFVTPIRAINNESTVEKEPTTSIMLKTCTEPWSNQGADQHNSLNDSPQSIGGFGSPFDLASPIVSSAPTASSVPLFPGTLSSSPALASPPSTPSFAASQRVQSLSPPSSAPSDSAQETPSQSPLSASLIPASPASPLSLPPTPDQPIPFLRYALSQLPFTIPLPLDNRRQSLKTVVAKLLLARQTGRKANFHKLWEIVASPVDQPMPVQTQPDVIETFVVKFAGVVMPGIYLRYVPNEHGKNKICCFGCTKQGRHQFISNSKYHSLALKFHIYAFFRPLF